MKLIVMSIKRNLLMHIITCETAYEMWEQLNLIF